MVGDEFLVGVGQAGVVGCGGPPAWVVDDVFQFVQHVEALCLGRVLLANVDGNYSAACRRA